MLSRWKVVFKVNCDRRREAIKRRRLRFRYARGIDDKAFGEVDNELERSLVSSAHAMAFSHAVHVDEDEEERRAQREVDNWKYQGELKCFFDLKSYRLMNNRYRSS